MWDGRRCDLLIGIPHTGLVSTEWALEFAGMWRNAPPNTFVQLGPEPQIDVCREKLAQIAIKYNAKHLLFIDSDVLPPRDLIYRLLKHNLPIVAGLYARRHNPPFNEMLLQASRIDPKQDRGYIPINEGMYEKGALVECDVVGCGCVLIQTQVFKELETPWFRWTEGGALSGESEDFNFFKKCRRAGWKVFCDTSIVCKHLGTMKFVPGRGSPGLEFPNYGSLYVD